MGFGHEKEAPAAGAFRFFRQGDALRGLVRRGIREGSGVLSPGPGKKRCYITVFHQKAHLSGKKVKFFFILDVLFDGEAFIIAVNGDPDGKNVRKPARL